MGNEAIGRCSPSRSKYDQLSSRRRESPKPMDVLGIVLAGVHSWGESPLEQILCRSLLPIMSQPLITHALSWLAQAGINQAQICANSDTPLMRRTLGLRGPQGLSLGYYEDTMPRGPAGCVKDAATGHQFDALVVVDSTILPCIDLKAVLQAHQASDAAVTIVAATQEEANPSAVNTLEPVGILVFSPTALDCIPDVGYQDIKETLIARLYELDKQVGTYVVPRASVPRVGGSGSYLAVNKWALARAIAKETPPAGYQRVGSAWIHSSADIDSTVQLVGPVLIGPDTSIESDVTIVGPTSIGCNCSIGRQVVISSSAIWDNCQVDSGAVVEQCVLTYESYLDSQTVVRKTVCVSARRARPSLLNWFQN